MDTICKLGPANKENSHPVHNLFVTEIVIFESYGLVTFEQVIEVSNTIYVGISAQALIE